MHAVASVVGVGMGACLELLVRLPLTKRFAWAQYPDKLSHMHEEPRNAIAGKPSGFRGLGFLGSSLVVGFRVQASR